MEKVLQELFGAPIPFKSYQNTSRCSTELYFQETFTKPTSLKSFWVLKAHWS